MTSECLCSGNSCDERLENEDMSTPESWKVRKIDGT